MYRSRKYIISMQLSSRLRTSTPQNTMLLLRVVSIVIAAVACTSAKVPLAVHVIFPYPSDDPFLHPSWSDGPQLFTAASLAAEHINSDPSLLRDYELRLVEGDGGCDITTKAAEAVVSAIADTNRVVAVIGPGCSESTLLATPITSRQEVALINVHTAGSPVLANSTLYPFGISILGTTIGFLNATIALMEKVNWNRVAVFYEETRPYFATTYQFLLQRFKEMEKNNFELALQTVVSDTHIPLETIRSEEIRIVYVLTGPDLASKIMCLADHMGLVSPNIQWLFFGRDFSEFRRHVSFNYGSTNYTCMEERMRKALMMNLFMNFKLIPFEQDFDRMTIAGITYNEFKDMYNERLMKSGYEMNIWGPIAYDAVWSLALCLNNTVNKINLTDYGPGQWKSSKLIRECFNTLNFTGVSGDILFDPQTGFIDRTVDIYQTLNGSAVYYGAYYTDRMLTKLKSLQVIPDSYQNKILQFWDIAAVFLFLAVSFCLLIITSHVLTIAYGSYHSIKASSPKITHFIFVGCYMLTVGTVLYTASFGVGSMQAHGWICQLSFGFFYPIGFTLIFASVLVRTWRLYRIFIHYLDPGIFINDKFLITVICCMVGVNILIGIVWSAIDPFVGAYICVRITEDSDGLLVNEVIVTCNTKNNFLWAPLVFGYMFVEVIPVFVLALLTRSIRSKDFSTKRVRVYVYLISMGFLFFMPVYYIITTGIDYGNTELLVIVNYISLFLLVLYFLASSLFVLFIPPLIPLFKDKLPGFKGKYEMLKRAKRLISFPGVITLTKSETVTSSTQ